jgi:hypothetical protein
MNIQQLWEFVSLENRKKDLDAELKAVKQQLDGLEEALIPQFLDSGVQKMTVDGRTVSIQQDVYASPLNDRGDVVDALKHSELGQFVAENYNTNSLTAFVREIKREVESRAQQDDRMYTEEDVRAALPDPLGRALKISFVHKLSSRKA